MIFLPLDHEFHEGRKGIYFKYLVFEYLVFKYLDSLVYLPCLVQGLAHKKNIKIFIN